MYFGLKTNKIWTILTWGIPKHYWKSPYLRPKVGYHDPELRLFLQSILSHDTLTKGRTNSRFSSAIRGYKEISLAAAAHASAAGPRAFSPAGGADEWWKLLLNAKMFILSRFCNWSGVSGHGFLVLDIVELDCIVGTLLFPLWGNQLIDLTGIILPLVI